MAFPFCDAFPEKTYTIGRLYILKDEDVKKRTIESVNKCRILNVRV